MFIAKLDTILLDILAWTEWLGGSPNLTYLMYAVCNNVFEWDMGVSKTFSNGRRNGGQ